MSELFIKRQTLRKDIRRAEIKETLRSYRQQLLNALPLPPLTQQELDLLYNQLEDNQYRTHSLLSFISTVQKRDTRSLDRPQLFVRLHRILAYIEEREQAQIAKRMVREICERVVREAIARPSFMQKFFKEFLQLIGNHSFELECIWPSIGLVRNEVFFKSSFDWFLDYLRSYPYDFMEMLSPILLTFLNFTVQLEEAPHVRLGTNQYFSIVDSIHTIMKSYTIDDLDLQNVAKTITKIIKMFPIEEGLEIVEIHTLLTQFLSQIDSRAKNQCLQKCSALGPVLELIGLALAGSEKQIFRIFQHNSNLLEVLCKVLPINSPFKKVKVPRPVQWTHQNVSAVTATLFALCNLATNSSCRIQLITSGTLGFVIELSAFPSPNVHEEVGIFLWNMLSDDNDEMVELLCDNDILYALGNILRNEHSNDVLTFGLRCLQRVLLVAGSFPSQNNYWQYSLPRIKNYLMHTDAYNVLESLCIHPNGNISGQASKCLDALG